MFMTESAKTTTPEKIERTEISTTAPYSDITVGIMTVLFGPITGGILAYISLKNLKNESAMYVLMGSFGLTIVLLLVLMTVLYNVEFPSIVIQAPLAAIFVLAQQKTVKAWAESNQTHKYQAWWKGLLWGLLGTVIYFILAFMVAFAVESFISVPALNG